VILARFVITSKPRTKKTSNRIVRIKSKDGGEFIKVMPSKAFMEWQKDAIEQAQLIRPALIANGLKLPITCPISVKTLVFRGQYSGDLCGFEQAIGDALQEPQYKPNPKNNNIPRQTRAGMGIIGDDEQIKSWDGSRLYFDADHPRVEITIEEFLEDPIQTGMFEEVIELSAPAKPVVAKRKPFVIDDDPSW